MATITAGDFRNGKTFEMDGKIMQVVEFQHVKPGKGAAFVRTKMKNIVTGAVTETSFNPTAKFEEAFIERKDAEYSYNDGDLYYFMDQETYDMIPIGKETLDDSFRFIRAEVIAFDDLKACGTLANAKAKGLLRSEGKEYVMHDGDVVNFLFNV